MLVVAVQVLLEEAAVVVVLVALADLVEQRRVVVEHASLILGRIVLESTRALLLR